MSKFENDFEEAFLQGTIWLSDIGFCVFLLVSSPIWFIPYILKIRDSKKETREALEKIRGNE